MPNKILRLFLKAYQYLISPLFGPCCRFYPTCSHYALEATEKHGAGRGFLLTLGRLLRCHPFYRGNPVDPVPETFDRRSLIRYNRQDRKDKHQHNKQA